MGKESKETDSGSLENPCALKAWELGQEELGFWGRMRNAIAYPYDHRPTCFCPDCYHFRGNPDTLGKPYYVCASNRPGEYFPSLSEVQEYVNSLHPDRGIILFTRKARTHSRWYREEVR